MPDGHIAEDTIFHQLLANSFFAQFEPESLRRLAAISLPCHFTTGDCLIEQGSCSTGILILEKGQAAVSVAVNDRYQKVARIGPGGIVGELSLLLNSPHSARVRAETPVDAIRIPADAFRDFMARDSRSLAALSRVLAERVQRTTHPLAHLSYIASAVLSDGFEPSQLAEIREQTNGIGCFAELFEDMLHYLAERTQRLETAVAERTRDLTEEINRREAAEAELRHLATTDPLTGANNRRHFFEMAERELNRAERYGRPLAIFLMDIDRFKSVNDTYGHSIGDDVIKAVVKIILENLRSQDVLGRIGGEEFAVLVPECPLEDAVLLADRLRQTIADTRIATPKGPLSCTVSAGVADCGKLHSVKAALEAADGALYAAKEAGRNKIFHVLDL